MSANPQNPDASFVDRWTTPPPDASRRNSPMPDTHAPSSWQIEQAMSIAHSTMTRLQNAGDIPAEEGDESALLEALRASGADIGSLVTRLIRAALEAEALESSTSERMKVLADRKARFHRRSDAWRGAAFAIMDALDIKKIEDAEFTASIRASGAAVVVTDEEAIPDEYFITERKLSRAKLSNDIKAGVVIAGAELSNGIPGLTVRSR